VPQVNCKICSKQFYAKPFWIRRGKGKYCSPDCQHLGARKGKVIKCDICGKEAYRPLGKLKHSKSKKFFCSKSCQTKWRNSEFVGPKHANWQNGRYAYKSVLLRNKISPQCKLCGINDKRVLATHHLDRDRKNNLVKNLVWLCHNCHHLVHFDSVEKLKLQGLLKT